KERIYREVELEYRMEDARNHYADYIKRHEDVKGTLPDDLSDADAKMLAERYIFKLHDCNLAENDVFQEMIREFVEDIKAEK
ncbi:MAG: hypothetical protein Q4B26_20910, partial [Eubacteriales bacterium]|nr:hypothetical protein [Eubacteriales bacterium]